MFQIKPNKLSYVKYDPHLSLVSLVGVLVCIEFALGCLVSTLNKKLTIFIGRFSNQ